MTRLRLPIPSSLLSIMQQQGKYKHCYEMMLDLVDLLSMPGELLISVCMLQVRNYTTVIDRVPPRLASLLRPYTQRLENAIMPGLYNLSWHSLSLEQYFVLVNDHTAELELLLDKINDIVECRIDKNLRSILKIRLVTIPSKLVTVDHFREMAQHAIEQGVPQMSVMRQNVETAVYDMLQLVSSRLDSAEKQSIADAQAQLLEHYQRLCERAVMGAIVESLNVLRERFAPPKDSLLAAMSGEQQEPIFAVGMELVAPEVNMNPSLGEVQIVINQIAKGIVSSSKQINRWKSPDASEEEEPGYLPPKSVWDSANRCGYRSYFDEIAKDKGLAKVLLLLTGSLTGLWIKV